MLWQAAFDACCRWPTARPSKTASPIPSLPSRLTCLRTPRLPSCWRFRLRVETAEDAGVQHRHTWWIGLRVETADDTRIGDGRRGHLAGWIGLRVEGLGCAHTHSKSCERDAA